MGDPSHRYVARAEAGVGWRVWDRKLRRWWGNYFNEFPEKLLAELNGEKRPEEIADECRRTTHCVCLGLPRVWQGEYFAPRCYGDGTIQGEEGTVVIRQVLDLGTPLEVNCKYCGVKFRTTSYLDDGES